MMDPRFTVFYGHEMSNMSNSRILRKWLARSTRPQQTHTHTWHERWLDRLGSDALSRSGNALSSPVINSSLFFLSHCCYNMGALPQSPRGPIL